MTEAILLWFLFTTGSGNQATTWFPRPFKTGTACLHTAEQINASEAATRAYCVSAAAEE